MHRLIWNKAFSNWETETYEYETYVISFGPKDFLEEELKLIKKSRMVNGEGLFWADTFEIQEVVVTLNGEEINED